MQYPRPIQNLIDEFTKFPGVGPRTASRYVFYLLKSSPQRTKKLQRALSKLHREIKTCSFCYNPYQAENSELCKICRDGTRDRTLCLVEKEADLLSIEEANAYDGLYFLLGGTIPTLEKSEPEKEIRINQLIERVENPDKFGVEGPIQEIIIATNPTTEGETTALYLERKLKELDISEEIKVTRLGRGMPVGGELEYADDETLSSALKSRR